MGKIENKNETIWDVVMEFPTSSTEYFVFLPSADIATCDGHSNKDQEEEDSNAPTHSEQQHKH